jgi:T5orf172 domain
MSGRGVWDEGCIYVGYTEDRGDLGYKIGYTGEPRRRWAQLRRKYGSFQPMAVVWLPAAYEIEQYLHARYRELSVPGDEEWHWLRLAQVHGIIAALRTAEQTGDFSLLVESGAIERRGQEELDRVEQALEARRRAPTAEQLLQRARQVLDDAELRLAAQQDQDNASQEPMASQDQDDEQSRTASDHLNHETPDYLAM